MQFEYVRQQHSQWWAYNELDENDNHFDQCGLNSQTFIVDHRQHYEWKQTRVHATKYDLTASLAVKDDEKHYVRHGHNQVWRVRLQCERPERSRGRQIERLEVEADIDQLSPFADGDVEDQRGYRYREEYILHHWSYLPQNVIIKVDWHADSVLRYERGVLDHLLVSIAETVWVRKLVGTLDRDFKPAGFTCGEDQYLANGVNAMHDPASIL